MTEKKFHSVFVPKEQMWAVFEGENNTIDRNNIVCCFVYEESFPEQKKPLVEVDAMVLLEDGLWEAEDFDTFLGFECCTQKLDDYWLQEIERRKKK